MGLLKIAFPLEFPLAHFALEESHDESEDHHPDRHDDQVSLKVGEKIGPDRKLICHGTLGDAGQFPEIAIETERPMELVILCLVEECGVNPSAEGLADLLEERRPPKDRPDLAK